MSYSHSRTPAKRQIGFGLLFGSIAVSWGIILAVFTLLVFLVAGCSTGTPTSGIDPSVTQEVAAVKDSAWGGFCAVAKVISYSSKDTAETQLEVRKHNHLGAVHCGWPE